MMRSSSDGLLQFWIFRDNDHAEKHHQHRDGILPSGARFSDGRELARAGMNPNAHK